MRIINQTNNSVLAQEVILADTPFKRMVGLLSRKEFKKGQALIIRPCNSVHTFFMRFSIDVLFVDKNNQVVKAFSSLMPFRLTGVYFNSAFAIEFPSGTLQATSTSKGNTVLIT